MKKVLSFVLVLAMILGSVSMAFAAPATSKTETVDKNNTAVPFADAQGNMVTTILRDLGAIKGSLNDKGEYVVNPDGELTRAEATALVVIAMGLGDQGAVKTATPFADVDKDAWYSGYVAVAAAQGFVGGYAGQFNPDQKMSMDEVAALILKVLGYSDAHLEGAWPANWRDLALAKGVLTDVELGSQTATRQDIFQFLFNCLDQDMVVWAESMLNGDKYSSAPNGLNLLQKMTGVQTTMAAYRISGPAVVDENTDFANKFDASAFYGKTVDLLEKQDRDGVWYTIGIAKSYSKSVEGKFADGTVTTFTAIDGTVYTFDAGTQAATKYFLNGGLGTLDNYTPNKSETVTLEVQLNKTNAAKIATIDAIHREAVTRTFQATSTQAALLAEANIYKFMHATVADVPTTLKAFAVTDAGLTRYEVLDPEVQPVVIVGVAEKLSDIKEDDIVELYINPNTNAVSKVVVTRTVVTGAMTNYDSKNDTYTMGGKAYGLAAAAQRVNIDDLAAANVPAAIKGATEYAFYLNGAGKVVKAEIVDNSEKLGPARYAIVLEATNVVEYTQEGKTFKPATNVAIRLLPLDTMVEEKYEVISVAAMKVTAQAFAANDAWNTTNISTGAIVEIRTAGDELKGITPSGLETAQNVTFSAIGFTGGTSGLYGDVKIVVSKAAVNKAPTEAAFYGAKTVADMNKATAASIIYKTDDNGKVDLVYIVNYNAATTQKVITAAAIIGIDTDAKGTKVTFLQPGADATEVLYFAKNVDANTAGIKAKTATLFALTLVDNKISTATDLSGQRNTVAATATDLEYANGIFTNLEDESLSEIVVDGVKVMKYNDARGAEALENVAIADVNDALAKAKKVDFYHIYNSTFSDVVIIY